MSSLNIIENVRAGNKVSLVNNSAVLHHQIEKEHRRTVGNINSNGAALTTTATTSSAKFSVISTSQGKSVVSSLSMSMERKDSIQYIPKNIPPVMPAGQNTVIHVDNYTHFMAQRVTTKTTKRAEVSACHNSIVPRPKSGGDGVLDVNLTVLLGSVNSSSHTKKNKALKMNKQKTQDFKTKAPSKMRGRKNSLPLNCQKPKEENKIIDNNKDIAVNSAKIKPILKKTIANRRKKVIKPIKVRTPDNPKPETVAEQKIVATDGAGEEEIDTKQKSPSVPSTSESKILKPCINTMQNKICISEMQCPYMHSDFPCKYYYLNIPCPQDLNCQFMHNGNLEPKLEEALRNHILDLLSTNPSSIETQFVEQLHYIEDLSRRLHSFDLQPVEKNQAENEAVMSAEVMNDADDDVVLVVDESSNEFNTNNISADDSTTVTNSLQHTDESIAFQPIINEIDNLHENITETNSTVDEIGNKLKLLKANTNISPMQRINELQNIYDLIKQQENRLKMYENLNIIAANAEVKTINDNRQNDSVFLSQNIDRDQSHIVLVNPYIVNAIQTIESQENLDNIITDDENSMTKTELATESQESNELGTKFQTTKNKGEENVIILTDDENTMSAFETECSQATNLNLPKKGSVEIISNEELTQGDSGGKNEMKTVLECIVINDTNIPTNTNYEKQHHTTSIETMPNNLNVNANENYKNLENDNAECIENNNLETEQFECEDERLEKNNAEMLDKNSSPTLHNESLELQLEKNDKELFENNIKKTNNKELEDISPPYEYLSSANKSEKRCLRSQAVQDTDKTLNKDDDNKLTAKTPERIKPYRTRRLRLPKPIKKTTDKSDIDEESEINVDIFKNPIKSTEDDNRTQNEEVPPVTQKVILTTRFMKKAKIKHELQQQHSVDIEKIGNKIKHIDTTEIGSNDYPTSSDNRTLSDNFKSPGEFQKSTTLKNANLKRRISFETPTSSLAALASTTIKEKFNLGNPQVVLTKLKTPFILQKSEKDIQADSTTFHVNSIVTSSTVPLDDKSTQKRHSFSLDTSQKANKYSKIENSKSIIKVKTDRRVRRVSQQSYDSQDGDVDTASSDEKLTMASDNSNEQEEAYESSSTTREQQNDNTHQYKHKEQQENESSLRQQIENFSNKSDLQLQTQKQYEEEEKIWKEEENVEKVLVNHEQCNENENETEEGEITNDSISCEKDEARIYKAEKQSSNSRNKNSNENILAEKEEEQKEYSTYSPLFNKLSNDSIERQINFDNYSDNITPISSPTYENDTIASPSPIRKLIDFRMGGEVDGRLTNPAIPYILHEIDLGKVLVNKPLFIDKLKKTIQLDPRIFRTHVKTIILGKTVETTSNALVPITKSETYNFTSPRRASSSSFAQHTTTSMISPYDPRNRTSGIITTTDIATPSLSHETALTPYNSRQTGAAISSSFFHTDIPNSAPLALQYHSTSQPIIQPHQQQTPNMFLYGCLQRSSWYQSLMSTMKIQINQSISQLVRALNNFHRERAFNPDLIFDVFKIDCAGEVLEIMRNLGVFVDVHGVINEQHLVTSFSGHTCCKETTAVNATYNSLFQQFLTPNAHCTGLPTASSSCYNNEPMLSCYVRAPEPVHKNSTSCCVTTPQPQNECTHCNRNCNNNNRNNDNTNNNYNNQNNNKRYGNQFKKPYDNDKDSNNNNDNNNGGSNYQKRFNQRSSFNNNYNNNPRFRKPGSSSPKNNEPEKSFGGNDGGGGGYAGARGRGGRFNNNRRFNNYNNNDNNNNNSEGGSSWSSSGANEKSYNNKYQSNNSPTRVDQSNSLSGSLRAAEPKASSPAPENSIAKASKPTSNEDEECWDSDN